MSLLSRRNFLVGAGGCAAASTLLGRAPSARADAQTTPKRVMMLLCVGGWDISYALDPKPGIPTVDSPEGDVQMFEDIPILTHESRPDITSFFEAYAPITAVINGVDVSSIAHDQCRARILTGNSSATGADVGAIVAAELAPDFDAPYLSLSQYAFVGDLGVHAVRVGATNQINALLEPTGGYPIAPDSPFAHGGFVPASGEESLMRAFVEERAARVQAERAALGFNADRVADYLASLGKGDRLLERAGDFGLLGQPMDLQQQATLALSALADDLAWSVSLSVGGFDTHDDNSPQGPLQNAVFGGLASVAAALEATPGSRAGSNLLDETIVIAFSEMSRTPRLNESGGKDHHPVTSALVFGGGVAGGRTFGATDDDVRAMPVDFETGNPDDAGATLTAGSLLGGLVQLAGADPSPYISNAAPFSPLCA